MVTITNSSKRNTAWKRFKKNRLGYSSFWIFLVIFTVSLCAELVANDKPIIAVYQGQVFLPIIKVYPETAFGGDFESNTDFHDPIIRKNLSEKGKRILFQGEIRLIHSAISRKIIFIIETDLLLH